MELQLEGQNITLSAIRSRSRKWDRNFSEAF